MSDETKLFQNMRSMISLIDKLRDFNLDDYISLPRIAVLGEQSAGKSSLLESIAGLTFLPRGTGIVTRRPLELRMIRKQVDVPYFVFPKDLGERKITNPAEATKIIEELTDKEGGDKKNISAVPIICRIYSPTVPDLTLIDLPGITRNPVADQPDNIEEITKGLVSLYMKNEDTLILCVIPANIDLSNSDALNFAKKLDPRGERTLGVLTKIDLMDEGTDARKTLNNKEIKLKHGYVGIKGRSQADIQRGISMKDAIQKEIDFFGKHPIYSSLPTHLCGTLSLIDRISKLLYLMIQKSLPKIQKEIGVRKKNVKKNLDRLGEEFPEEEEKKLEIVFRLVRNFKEFFDQEINGRYVHQKLNKNDKITNLHQRNSETITYKLNNLFKELYSEYTDKDFRVCDTYTDDQIKNAIDVYQGDTIPGFQSFDSFLFLIHPQLDKIKPPIYHLIEEAKVILEERGLQILDKVFKNFSHLHSEVRETFSKLLNDKKKETRKILENVISCEDNYLFSNDPLLLSTVDRSRKRKGVRAMNVRDMLVLELRNRIDNYFFIVVRNLRDSIPKLIGQFLLKKFNNSLEVEILNELNSKDYCLDSMYENKKTKIERDALKKEFDALIKAESLLVSDFGMGFTVLPESSSSQKKIEKNHKIDFDENYQSTVLDDDLLDRFDEINEDFLRYNEQILISQNNKNNNLIMKNQHQKHKSRKSINSNSKTKKSSGKGISRKGSITNTKRNSNAHNQRGSITTNQKRNQPTQNNERRQSGLNNNKNQNNTNQNPNNFNNNNRNNPNNNITNSNQKRNIRNHKSPFNKLGNKGMKGNIFNKGKTTNHSNNLFGNVQSKNTGINNNTNNNTRNNGENNNKKKKNYDGFLDFF